MDLLASLHLEELPEQQTRIAHLGERLQNNNDANDIISLGFNACCTCASRKNVKVECIACHRVKYCSKECRKQDASNKLDSNEETTAMGHSSIICALLALCQADEDAEASSSNNKRNKDDDEAALQRVQSEYESYPATLANVLLDAPCFQESIAKKTDLVIHVIGASSDVELWGSKRKDDAFDGYAEALSSVAEQHRLKTIRVCFVGPECPAKDLVEQRTKPNDDFYSYKFVGETRCRQYDAKDESLEKADLVVFFNPGFTCPDYEWDSALSSISKDTPFLVTTNTQFEAIADCQFLFEKGHVSALPPVVATVMQGDDNHDVVPVDEVMFFGENPYAGSRVRQSGTMANDLFVKNRWMFGGVLHSSAFVQTSEIEHDKASPKKRKREKSGNSKRKNPALI